MALLLSNEDAIKAQVLYWLRKQANAHPGCMTYLRVKDTGDDSWALKDVVSDLESIAATANAALRMIDEMREPPMDLDETAGMK